MRVRLWTDKEILKGGGPFFLKGAIKDKAVLLFHGWTSTPQELKTTAYHINKLGYSVYAPLLIGHGSEPSDMVGISWEDWLEDAQSFYDDLEKEYKHIIVGGMSMGANIALNLAINNHSAGVIAMGTPLYFQFEPILRVWSWIFRNQTFLRQKYYTPRDRKVVKKKIHYHKYPPISMFEAVRSGLLTRGKINQLESPVLAIHTNTDHVASVKSLKRIMKNAKSKIKEKIIVNGCYHVFTIDKCAPEVNAKIGKFVDKVFNQS